MLIREKLPQLFKVKEAAALLGVSKTMIYELMSKGALSYVQIGHTRRVPAESIWILIDEGYVGRG